jgi:hypothetical protein
MPKAMRIEVTIATPSRFDDRPDVTHPVVVASTNGPLPAPDWSLMAWPGVREMLVDVPPVRGWQMDALLPFDETTLRPLLSGGVPPQLGLPADPGGGRRVRYGTRPARCSLEEQRRVEACSSRSSTVDGSIVMSTGSARAALASIARPSVSRS